MNLDTAFVERLLQEPDLSKFNDTHVEPDMLFDKARDSLKFVLAFYAPTQILRCFMTQLLRGCLHGLVPKEE